MAVSIAKLTGIVAGLVLQPSVRQLYYPATPTKSNLLLLLSFLQAGFLTCGVVFDLPLRETDTLACDFIAAGTAADCVFNGMFS